MTRPTIAAHLLSAAQKGAVRRAKDTVGDGWLVLPVYRDRGVLAASLVQAGLATVTTRGVALNSAGKRLRKQLLAEVSE